MSRLIKEDPLAVCPFFGAFNAHVVVCDDSDGIVISRAFVDASECSEHREDFCRCKKEGDGEPLFSYTACPYYTLILEERETARIWRRENQI